jgi:hypothetical protein
MTLNIGRMATTWNLPEYFFSALDLGEVYRLIAFQTRGCVATWKRDVGCNPDFAVSAAFSASFWT